MEGVFTECVREAKEEGRSVLLSSHIFAEVEKLCDTVTIIRDGRTVEAGTLASLRHLRRSTISVTLEKDPAPLRRSTAFTSCSSTITTSASPSTRAPCRA